MPPPRALCHSIRLIRRIQMVHFPTQSNGWLWSYQLLCTFVLRESTYRLCDAECYKHATASGLIPFDSSRPTDSNGALPDSICLLAVELPSGLYFWSRAGTFRLFAAECYMHATASSLIPLNPSRRAESNELSPSSGAPLAGELSLYLTLLTATGMPPLRALYHSIRLARRIQMVRFPSRSDRWLGSYLLVCTFVYRAGTFRLFAAECYKHATASSLIPLYSSRRAESNELSPGSGAPLAGELSLYLTLLAATAMPPLRALHHSIRLVRRIQMVCFPSRSDCWLWSYLLVCTFVHRAGTFRLFAAECYEHATASSLIPLNSSRRAESNELSPGSGAPLAGELSLSMTLLTATGMPPLGALYHSIQLVRRIQMVRFPT